MNTPEVLKLKAKPSGVPETVKKFATCMMWRQMQTDGTIGALNRRMKRHISVLVGLLLLVSCGQGPVTDAASPYRREAVAPHRLTSESALPLFSVPFKAMDEKRNLLGDTPSPDGYFSADLLERRLTIHLPERANARIRLRFALQASQQKFWTFSTYLTASSPDVMVSGVLQDRVNTEDGSEVNGVRRFAAQSIPVSSAEPLFVNYNLREAGRSEATSLALQILVLDFYVTGSTTSPTTITLSAPLLSHKQDFLLGGDAVNYIDAATILSLEQNQNAQLRRLINVGRHKVWVLGLRNMAQAIAVEKIVASHPDLSNVKFLLALGGLITRKTCDVQHYEKNGAKTFEAIPKFVETSEVNRGILPTIGAVLRDNCVSLKDPKDPRRVELLRLVNEKLEVATMLGARIAGIYLLDEAGSAGVPASYLNQIYTYLGERRPDLPVVVTHSFYIGSGLLADRFNPAFIQRYYSPASADIFFFDHYSLPSLRRGSLVRQERFFRFLYANGMLSKPFIRLLGSTINDLNPCDLDKVGFLRMNRLALSVRDELPDAAKINWQRNLGFWAFFNRFGRTNPQTSWRATLAWQPQDYCHAQFEAALALSRQN